MKFQVITLFPELIEAVTSAGVLGQAQSKNILQVSTINPRKFTADVHKTVDDRPFGGGDGMVMLAEPLTKAIGEAITQGFEATGEEAFVVYMSPQGIPLDQVKVVELAHKKNFVLICGRYGGIDQRVINQMVDEEISIGDYVISGGEIAASVLIDAVSRQIPGVLGHDNSAKSDSFAEDLRGFLESPNFTRPREFLGESVPEVLLGGHHQKIADWKNFVSILVTLQKRPDLVLDVKFEKKELQKLKAFWQSLSEQDKTIIGIDALTDRDLELLTSSGQFKDLQL